MESTAVKHQDNHPVHVLFVTSTSTPDNSPTGQLATSSSSFGETVIRKLSFNTRTGRTCLVEVLKPFNQPAVVVTNLAFLSATSSIYVTTKNEILRIPTARCGRFRSKGACLKAMDPYCGWNREKGVCTATPNKNPRAAYWQQDLLECPVLTEPVRFETLDLKHHFVLAFFSQSTPPDEFLFASVKIKIN